MEPGLKIEFWNTIGLSEEKMSDEACKRGINKYDILFLTETWLRRDYINNLRYPNGYLFLEIKGEKEAVHQGGSSLLQQSSLFRNELSKVVSVFDKSI